MDVTLAASVDEFFHEVVSEALSAVDLDASEPAGWYLVGLLGEFTTARVSDEPLGMKLAAAGHSPEQRVRTLKEVGDTSLYVAGFFAESLTRSLVDIDYYVGLGQAAYSQLARSLGPGSPRSSIPPHAHPGVLPRPAKPRSSIAPHSHPGVLPRPAKPRSSIGEVYEELAAKFPQFVDVLAAVRKRVTIAELNATSDTSRLYEIWLRTRDEWVEKKLKQAGMLVDPGTRVIQ